MKRHTPAVSHDLQGLAEDARELLSATGHLAEEKIVQARKRLADALEKGRETWEHVQERAIRGARATDETIRGHPYQAVGIAFGVGALLGYLLTRRN